MPSPGLLAPPPRIYRPSYGPAATRLRLMIMITWMIKKISRQTRMMDRFFLVRNQIAFDTNSSTMCTVHVFQTLKNGFSNRAYGIMVSPLFLFAFFLLVVVL